MSESLRMTVSQSLGREVGVLTVRQNEGLAFDSPSNVLAEFLRLRQQEPELRYEACGSILRLDCLYSLVEVVAGACETRQLRERMEFECESHSRPFIPGMEPGAYMPYAA